MTEPVQDDRLREAVTSAAQSRRLLRAKIDSRARGIRWMERQADLILERTVHLLDLINAFEAAPPSERRDEAIAKGMTLVHESEELEAQFRADALESREELGWLAQQIQYRFRQLELMESGLPLVSAEDAGLPFDRAEARRIGRAVRLLDRELGEEGSAKAFEGI